MELVDVGNSLEKYRPQEMVTCAEYKNDKAPQCQVKSRNFLFKVNKRKVVAME